MAEEIRRRYIPWTSENGFDLSFLTMKDVAKSARVSQHSIKSNVVNILRAMPISDRVPVLERILASRDGKIQRMRLENGA